MSDCPILFNAETKDLDQPLGLSENGKLIHQVIVKYLHEHKLTFTGGCRAFYAPKEWEALGEKYGRGSELIVIYDGGEVREAFDSEYKFDHEEGLRKKLNEIGYYAERCTGWYSAVYEG